MKQAYERPRLEVVCFEIMDIVRTSQQWETGDGDGSFDGYEPGWW